MHAKATYVADPDFTLYVGEVREQLRNLPAESVHCVVTSPPYWGLRDYGTGVWDGGDPDCDHLGKPFRTKAKLNENWGAGFSDVKNTEDREPMGQTCSKCGARRVDQQLGLEPTPDLYVQNMVDVFREVRRVLRRDGTCWINIGDSYASSPPGNTTKGVSGKSTLHGVMSERYRDTLEAGHATKRNTVVEGLKPKDLVGIPWRLAFALQADGWYLRSDVIWAKPNPMPESVTDRPTKAHEYLFLLTRSPRYFYDAESVREDYAPKTLTHRGGGKAAGKAGQQDANGKVASGNFGEWDKPRTAYAPPTPQDETLDGSEGETPRGPDGRRKTHVEKGDGSLQHRDGERWPNGGRNRRSVWEIATEPYPDAHFATFPQALVEPCVLAGTSERGCCPECGAPWEREIETNNPSKYAADDKTLGWANTHSKTSNAQSSKSLHRNPGGIYSSAVFKGWRPTCEHDHEPVPCVVADIFMGSGTTALVARRLGRKSIGIELNPEYARLCAHRLRQLSLLA